MIRPYAPKDRARVERINVAYYASRHGFDASFSTAVTTAMDAMEPSLAVGMAMGWVIEDAGTVAGSIFLTPDGANTGRIRLLFLHPDLHGRGLGRGLLTHGLRAAPTLGFKALCVSTFTIHTAACALYERAAFQQTGQSAKRMFGRDLTQVTYVKPCLAQS